MDFMYIELRITYLKMCVRPKSIGPHGSIYERFCILLCSCRDVLQYFLSEIV